METAAMPTERSVTIAEAARLAGVTKATIRSRIARGTIKAELRGGVRRIAVTELERVGLLHKAQAEGAGEEVPLTVDELLDRLQRQAEQIGRLEVENERLRQELQAERLLRERAERRARSD